MSYVLIIHDVADYAAWKLVFDGATDIRKAAGERHYQLLNFHSQPNKIVHFSEWVSTEAARIFFESAKLIQIRKDAGVIAPEFIYLDEIEAGYL